MTTIELLTGIIMLETTYLTYVSLSSWQPRRKKQQIICDTSALIDGRIVTIARSGFIDATLVVPRSVTRELQFLADKADHDKRERARYGLDVIQELQALPDVDVVLYDDGAHPQEGVDERLIEIAKKLHAKLCTTDYNLNKVARTESVTVVNVNEIAHALRPMYLPGEKLTLAIVAAGQGRDQGVGYLDDGTMVVVDNAKRAIGTTIEVETQRVLQTEAGRMVFAKNRERLDKPSTSQTSDKDKSTSKPRQHKSRSKRSSAPSKEDKLVELANKG